VGEARVADAAASTTASITTAGDPEQQKKRRISEHHSTLTLEPSKLNTGKLNSSPAD